MTTTRALLLALIAGIAVGAPAAAFAQNEKALKGPTVTDRKVPGAAPDFGMGANRRFGDRLPPEVFRRALGVLVAEDAPDKLRATPEQREKFKEMVDGFEASARKYRQEHAKEIEELRKAAGEVRADRQGARRPQGQREEPTKGDENLTPEQVKARDNARAQLRELMAGAPKIEDVYTKIWTELSEPQRTAVQAKLDDWRAEQTKKREDEYVRRQTAKKDQPTPPPTPPAAKPKTPAGAEPDEMMAPKGDEKAKAAERPDRPRAKDGQAAGGERAAAAARRERLLRIFSQLTPEEQDQLLQRLEARAKERRRPDGPADRPTPKPPADPEKVKIPKPEDDRK